ncbi:unnamed protein product, partial [Chrysoparadoxa australica]
AVRSQYWGFLRPIGAGGVPNVGLAVDQENEVSVQLFNVAELSMLQVLGACARGLEPPPPPAASRVCPLYVQ